MKTTSIHSPLRRSDLDNNLTRGNQAIVIAAEHIPAHKYWKIIVWINHEKKAFKLNFDGNFPFVSLN